MYRRIITATLTMGAAMVVLAGCKPQSPAATINANANLQLEGNINVGGESGDGTTMEKKEDAVTEKKEDGAMMKKEEPAEDAAIDAELKAMGDLGSDAELNEMEQEINAE